MASSLIDGIIDATVTSGKTRNVGKFAPANVDRVFPCELRAQRAKVVHYRVLSQRRADLGLLLHEVRVRVDPGHHPVFTSTTRTPGGPIATMSPFIRLELMVDGRGQVRQ
jgi:hypothetical protein